MKRKIPILLSALMFVLAIAVSSCKNWPYQGNDNYDTADTTLIVDQVEAIMNPQFSTIEEALTFRNYLLEEAKQDSFFISSPQELLRNVAGVVLKKNLHFTKKELYEEYVKNRAVYDNLPNSTASASTSDLKKEVDLSSTDLGSRQKEEDIISTSYEYRTDSSTGKKIQIKKEESYVK